MFLRSALLASAMMAATFAPAAAETTDDSCAPANFRIYFAEGAATLDATALQMLQVAERSVASCDYAELRVTLDASEPLAAERVAAIRAATEGRAWDSVQVDARWSTQQVAMGPAYAEMRVSPVATQAMPRGEAGV